MLYHVIPNIVEAMLPRFSHEKLRLAITLALRDNYYDEYNTKKDRSAATDIRFIFHRPSNYTKVFVNYKL